MVERSAALADDLGGASRPTPPSTWWSRRSSPSSASPTATATTPPSALLDAVNATGALATHTRLDGRLVLRVSTGQARTEARHLDEVWAAIAAAAGSATRREPTSAPTTLRAR